MKGTFKITLDYLKSIGACDEGRREFARAFPDGGEYQDVLDRCAEEGQVDFGAWLLDKLGRTDDVRVYGENVIDAEKTIIFAGQIEFRLGASAKYIIAGLGIKAGWSIEAGEGYGIFAGLHIKVTQWAERAIVTAKNKPDNLISGHWVERR